MLIEIQQLMISLGLGDDEKSAWSQLLPIMTNDELLALRKNLEDQLHKMTDLYLTALKQKSSAN